MKPYRLSLKWPIFLLPLIVGVSAAARPALEGPADFRLVFQTPDHAIAVYCDGDLDKSRAAKLAQQAKDAYEFVAAAQKWRNMKPIRAPFRVHVKTEMKKGTLGFSYKDVFTIGLAFLDDPLAQGTLAHELTHCQDDRQLGKARIPHYLMEGRALLDGRAYREKLGQGANAYDRSMKKRIVGFTAADAHEVLAEKPGQKEPEPGPLLSRMEFMGCFFMEFLRTGMNGGWPDILSRTARIVEDVGQGMEYGEAFKTEIGVSLDEAEKVFASFITKTQGRPQVRLKGTIWEDL
jgi:hypothetical protein